MSEQICKKAKSWLVLVNAPVSSRAHQCLLDLLEQTGQEVEQVICMGPAAAMACKGHELGVRYSDLAKLRQFNLLVCGMAARDYGAQGDNLHASFTVTGFMDILLKVKRAKERGVKVVVW